MAERECPLGIVVDQERRRDQAQRAQPLRVLRRQHHAEDATERFAAIVDRRIAELTDDGEQVFDVGFDVQSGFEIVRDFGLTEPAQIRTHDPCRTG